MHQVYAQGGKGSIDHLSVRVENLKERRNELVEEYMKQDIYLLGGVMLKAQDIYWNVYNIDITNSVTLSSLALKIFRTHYYDEPIYIPSQNEENFIRRAWFGAHTDVYKPYGENLYYYDVNSLYPFVMKKFPMPIGEGKWVDNLKDHTLDELYGFIEAYVYCPPSIKKPFLPYRDKKDNLLFPTGQFIGNYYSAELKYARGVQDNSTFRLPI